MWATEWIAATAGRMQLTKQSPHEVPLVAVPELSNVSRNLPQQMQFAQLSWN